MTSKRKPYNTYTKEFKLEALRMMDESDASLSIIDQIVDQAHLSNVMLGFEGNDEGQVIVENITMTDLSAIPVPGVFYLFVSGILGLLSIRKIRN